MLNQALTLVTKACMQNVHSEMYSRLIETYVKDTAEQFVSCVCLFLSLNSHFPRNHLFNAIENCLH